MSSVVYIDDEAMLCRVVSMVLRRIDVQVATFTDAEEAVAHVTDSAPDLVICDYRMPKMNGLEVLAALPDAIPFVLVSGDLNHGDLSNEGVTAVLAKPFRPDQLNALVSGLLDLKPTAPEANQAQP